MSVTSHHASAFVSVKHQSSDKEKKIKGIDDKFIEEIEEIIEEIVGNSKARHAELS